MSYPVNNAKTYEPSVGFDYGALDDALPTEIDAQWWTTQGELLGDILRWLTTARTLSGAGARVYLLALYLRPDLIGQNSLSKISHLKGAPTRAALSKALLELEGKYHLRPSPIQKPGWARERFARSASIGHEHRSRSQ